MVGVPAFLTEGISTGYGRYVVSQHLSLGVERGSRTALVGPNGSGKSNALEGIEVLASIAAGDPLREITDLDREGALNVRGGLQGCPRYGTNSFTLGFSVKMRWSGQYESTRYSVTVAPLPEPRIRAESLFHGDTMLFQEIKESGRPASARRGSPMRVAEGWRR